MNAIISELAREREPGVETAHQEIALLYDLLECFATDGIHSKHPDIVMHDGAREAERAPRAAQGEARALGRHVEGREHGDALPVQVPQRTRPVRAPLVRVW